MDCLAACCFSADFREHVNLIFTADTNVHYTCATNANLRREETNFYSVEGGCGISVFLFLVLLQFTGDGRQAGRTWTKDKQNQREDGHGI